MRKKRLLLSISFVLISSLFFINVFSQVDDSIVTIGVLDAACGDGVCNGAETGATCPGDCLPGIRNVNHSGITNQSAVINWTTDKLSNTTVKYGVIISLGNISQTNNAVLYHSRTLSGLTGNITYFYNVTSCYMNYCQTNGTYNFTTTPTPPELPPVISAINHTFTNDTAQINWTTDKLSNSSVNYGINKTLLGTILQVNDAVTTHTINITGLNVSTLYFYNITSCYASKCQTNGTYNFTTRATYVPPVTPPVVSGGGGGGRGRIITEFLPAAEKAAVPFTAKPAFKKFPAEEIMAAKFEKPLIDIQKLLALPIGRILIIIAVLAGAFLLGYLLSRRPAVVPQPKKEEITVDYYTSNELVVRNSFWPFKKEMSQIFVTCETDQLPKPARFSFGNNVYDFKFFHGDMSNFFKAALDSGPIMTNFGNKLIFAIKNDKNEFISLFKGESFKILYPGISMENSDVYYIDKKHNFDTKIQNNLWKMLEPKTERDARNYFSQLLASVNKVKLRSAVDLREYIRNIVMILQ